MKKKFSMEITNVCVEEQHTLNGRFFNIALKTFLLYLKKNK
jgi:hypothetical protein